METPRSREVASGPPSRNVVAVVTGLSGAGKSTALHALEDLSFFCIDNLPTPLIEPTLGECDQGGLTRVGLGVDVRVRTFFHDVGAVLDRIAASARDLHVLFLDATDEALLRRYSETRRPHPLSTVEESDGHALAVLDGIRIERERLAPLRARATRVIETTHTSVHDLRRLVVATLGPASGETARMRARIVSFGFKYGAPVEADLVFDVRFLENPFFVPKLRDLPGTHADVAEYVLGTREGGELIAKIEDLLAFTLPRYEREGKAYLTVAIGCTGGRHRSVAIAERLARDLARKTDLPIQIFHRDIDRGSRASHADAFGGGARGKGET